MTSPRRRPALRRHRTMTIPGSISVPGAELALRLPELAPDPTRRSSSFAPGARAASWARSRSSISACRIRCTRCATARSAGPSPASSSIRRRTRVCRRRRPTNTASGTEGYAVSPARAGVSCSTRDDIAQWSPPATRTTYRFDVRAPEDTAAATSRLPLDPRAVSWCRSPRCRALGAHGSCCGTRRRART